MQVQVANAVVRAQILSHLENLTLFDFMVYAQKQFLHRPTMAKFRHQGVTILIFTSLKCRSMGLPDHCNNNLEAILTRHKEILHDFITTTFPWTLQLQNVSLSTATATHQISHPVQLNTDYFMFEPELFSGAKLRMTESAHVNVFGNEKVVLLEIKSHEHVQSLLRYLYECIHK